MIPLEIQCYRNNSLIIDLQQHLLLESNCENPKPELN